MITSSETDLIVGGLDDDDDDCTYLIVGGLDDDDGLGVVLDLGVEGSQTGAVFLGRVEHLGLTHGQPGRQPAPDGLQLQSETTNHNRRLSPFRGMRIII